MLNGVVNCFFYWTVLQEDVMPPENIKNKEAQKSLLRSFLDFWLIFSKEKKLVREKKGNLA